jgi:asparagine synthase (glutamine-hydrolysing)
MTRLAVQDLSLAGHQPMSRGAKTLVYNGEIYNFRDLRAELESHGYSFQSDSDTEVVLNALDRWGTAALERFNGMFALALVDLEADEVLLARDRFGKKPLFLGQLRDGWIFASELKAIHLAAGDELTLDRDALAGYFRFQYVPAPQSIYQQVRKVPPGSWLTVGLSSGRASEPRPFWRLPEPERPLTHLAPQELVDVVREAVRIRMAADVPVGAFLSGGTDSSLVVACMRSLGGDVRTFSIGFDDPRFDESHYARAVAEHLETTHTHLQLTPRETLALVPRLAQAYDEPFADSSAIPTMAVSELARRDVTVSLSGDGGDELFGGYARYAQASLVRTANRLPRMAGALAFGRGRTRTGRRVDLFANLAGARTEGAAYEQLMSSWKRVELDRLMPGARASHVVADEFDRARGPCVERMMRADARTYLVDAILQKVDRASMAVSLEARNPLLDPAVVEAGLASAEVAAANPAVKPHLRDALRTFVPDDLVDRPKMGFGVPVGDWVRTELREMVEDLILARDEPEYDAATARAVVGDHLAGRYDATPQVWSLLVYELWRTRWLEGGSRWTSKPGVPAAA